MTRVLMVLPGGTLEEGYSGASSRYTQDFKALTHLGAEVHILRICPAAQMAALHHYEAALNRASNPAPSPASWVDVALPPVARPAGRWPTLRHSLTDPVHFQYPAKSAINAAIQESIARTRPDLLWLSGDVLVAAVEHTAIPIVYAQTDLAYRVQAVRTRGGSWRHKYFLWVHRRAEETVTRRATHIITGSATDANRLRRLGCEHVATIPTAYSPRPAPSPDPSRT